MIVPRYGTVRRGVEVFARELARRIDRQRFQLTILSGPHALDESGVETVELPLITREVITTWAWPILRHLPGRLHLGPAELEALSLMLRSRGFLQAREFDIILPFGGTWTYRFSHRHRHGARIISVGHGGPVGIDLDLSDVFVALTPTDEAQSLKLRTNITTRVIPNGIDTKQFRVAYNLSPRGEANPTILCVGALFPDKRHELLFNAAMRLDDSVRILCVGQGPCKSTLMEHPLCKQGRVDFLEKNHDEMPAIYQAADVFTLASPGEAFGLVFLEALACGLPVVAHDGERQRYVVGESGFFCDVLDPDSYALALNQALAVPDDSRRTRHAEKFSWDKVVAQYQALFLELAYWDRKDFAFMELQ